MNATQMNIVLWMNAAVGAVATARPLKNSTNGTLPPMTAIASTPSRGRGASDVASCRGAEEQRNRHEDDGGDRVLGGRVDGGVRDELHAERVEIDRQAADRGRREREQDAALRALDAGTVHDLTPSGSPSAPSSSWRSSLISDSSRTSRTSPAATSTQSPTAASGTRTSEARRATPSRSTSATLTVDGERPGGRGQRTSGATRLTGEPRYRGHDTPPGVSQAGVVHDRSVAR